MGFNSHYFDINNDAKTLWTDGEKRRILKNAHPGTKRYIKKLWWYKSSK